MVLGDIWTRQKVDCGHQDQKAARRLSEKSTTKAGMQRVDKSRSQRTGTRWGRQGISGAFVYPS